ncbi:hypothetical protein H696_05377 [Fonticula alba]|uniref:EGF-like domain-containing protein n=1 Tax=Fonticula alba TaxID=691883 RepID=A0A058Z1G6_FONAL|nr:hypothetical protein H696_05377 [Fonticula alba]KCV68119.1 hypothetical protein H696_05377 [Fonticula alba]|eukprot:XP_009497493.1 hypothetical protein H696_05377 [Fonticula alba]
MPSIAVIFEDEPACIDCHPNCQACDLAKPRECTECAPGLVLRADSTCQRTCGSGARASFDLAAGRSVCVPCPAGCVACDADGSCTACGTQLHLSPTGQCEVACPAGTTTILGTQVCAECAPNCDTCLGTGSHQCDFCATGYVAMHGECRSACPAGPAWASSSGACARLPVNCTDMVDGVCAGCAPGFFLMDKACVPCPSGCAACTFGTCTACQAGLFLRDGACQAICPSKTFADAAQRRCQACDGSCAECTGPLAGDCASCPAGRYLSSTNTCLPCVGANCAFCSQGQTCDRCEPGFWRHDGQCIGGNSCPAGYGPLPDMGNLAATQERICGPCHPTCGRCSGPGADQCTDCSEGLTLVAGTCTCPVDGACRTGCPAGCSVCDATGTACLRCDAGRLLDHAARACLGPGVTACPAGTYDDNQDGCRACPTANCHTCGPDGVCSRCASGFLLSGQACVAECPRGQQADGAGQCTAIPVAGCATAVGGKCTACLGDARLRDDGMACVTACPAGQAFNRPANTCDACPAGCLIDQCIAYTDSLGGGQEVLACKACPQGRVLARDGTCQAACPAGEFPKAGACIECHPSCGTCADGTTCLGCPAGKVLLEGACLDQQPTMTYVTTAGALARCPAGCDECEDGTGACDACTHGYFLLPAERTCVLGGCPAGSLQDNGTCRPCPSRCQRCRVDDGTLAGSSAGASSSASGSGAQGSGSGAGELVCELCQAPFYLHEGACVDACPARTYPAPADPDDMSQTVAGVCGPCADGCASCNCGAATGCCLSCQPDRVLLNLGCALDTCPERFFEIDGGGLDRACASCFNQCLECTSPEKADCDKWHPNYGKAMRLLTQALIIIAVIIGVFVIIGVGACIYRYKKHHVGKKGSSTSFEMS